MLQAEEDLVVMQAQLGSQAALGLLYRHYQVRLARFAYRLCSDDELAKDAVQEAWLHIAKRLRKLENPKIFRSWLYRAVRWRVLDALRKRSRYEEHCDSEHDLNEMAAPDLGDDSSHSLASLIKFLPKLESEIVHLFYLEEMKMREIALILDIPQGTVKSRLYRARETLKAQIID